MPSTTTTPPSHAAIQLAAQLAQPKPMRRGSLSDRFVKCGKPGCLCATDHNARHTPFMNSSGEARKCYHYIRRNRHRMRYPRFHPIGLCTSSGLVEAGCKVTITTRLKRAGMHWTVLGSNAIIALHCCILSGRFEDFWERRSVRREAA